MFFLILAVGVSEVGQEILPRHCSKKGLGRKTQTFPFALSLQEIWVHPWVGKIPWRRKRLPLQYSGLEISMNSIVHGVTKRDTTEWFSLSPFAILHTLCLGQLALGFLGSMRSCVTVMLLNSQCSMALLEAIEPHEGGSVHGTHSIHVALLHSPVGKPLGVERSLAGGSLYLHGVCQEALWLHLSCGVSAWCHLSFHQVQQLLLILLSVLVKVLCFNFCKPWLPLCVDKDGDWVGRWSHRSKNFHSWFIVVWDKLFSWWESYHQEMYFEASYMVFRIFLAMYMVCHPGMSFLKINFIFSQFLKWRVVLSACSWCLSLAPDLGSSVACILAGCVAGTGVLASCTMAYSFECSTPLFILSPWHNQELSADCFQRVEKPRKETITNSVF